RARLKSNSGATDPGCERSGVGRQLVRLAQLEICRIQRPEGEESVGWCFFRPRSKCRYLETCIFKDDRKCFDQPRTCKFGTVPHRFLGQAYNLRQSEQFI